MATRLYVTNSAPTYTPATVRSTGITTSAAMVSRALSTTKSGTNAAVSQAETSTSATYRALLIRAISEPLPSGGTTGGNITTMFARNESSTNMNAKRILTVYATVGDSGTVRGTLLSTNVDATEWPTTLTGGTDTIALSSVAVQAGDRIVIEVGYEAQNTSSTSMTGTMRYGGTDATDLTASTTGVTTRSPYVEFSGMDALFTAPKPLFETLTDNFSADNRATKWPDSYGTTNVSGGVGTVSAAGATAYSGLQSANDAFSLIESYFKTKMTPASGIYSGVTLKQTDDGNDISMLWSGGTLSLGTRTGYTHNSPGTVAVSAGTAIYVGVGEGVAGAAKFGGTGTAGNLYFYTSTNGTTWTQRKTVATPAYASAMTALLEAGEGTGTATFDDVNVDNAVTDFSGTLDLTLSRALTLAQTPSDIVFRQPINSVNVDVPTVTASVEIPETAQVGDALFYVYHTRELTSATHSMPSGFTNLIAASSGTRGAIRIGWRPIVSGDIGTTMNFTATNLAANDGKVTLMAVGGVDTSDLYAQVEGLTTGLGAGGGTQFSFPTRTPTVEKASYLYGGAWWHPTVASQHSAKSATIASLEIAQPPAANGVGTYLAAEHSETLTAYPARVFQVNTASTNALTWSIILRPLPKGNATPGTSERYYDTAATNAAIDAATSVTEMNAALDDMQAVYGITGAFVVNSTSTSFGSRSWTNPDISDVNLKSAVKNTVDALAKYPPEFVKQTGINDIAFVKNIVNGENPDADIAGFVNNAQMFLDIDNDTTSLSFGYIFHHEFEHIVGNVFAQYREMFEAEWIAANPPGFTYLGSSYDNAYSGDWPEGFVRPYARFSFNEDMAEVHAMLFSTAKQALLAQQVAADPYIAAKVALMKKWLAERSWQRVSGDAYYTNINLATSEEHSGSLSLTRTLALTLNGSASVSGTLSRSLTQTRTLTGSPAATGTLSKSLSVATTPSGSPSASGSLSLAVTRVLTVAGTPITGAALTLTSNRSLTLGGTPAATGNLTLNQVQTVSGTGTPTMAANLTLTREVAEALSGTPAMAASLSLSRTQTVGGVGIPTVANSLALAHTYGSTYTFAFSINGTLALTRTQTVASTGTPAITSSLTVSRPLVLSLTASHTQSGALTMPLTYGLILSGTAFQQGAGSIHLARVQTIAVSGSPAVAGNLSINRAQTLALSGSPSAVGALSLSTSRSLTNGGAPNPMATLVQTLAESLTASGNPAITSTLALSRTLSEILAGVPGFTDTLSLSLTRSLVLAGASDGVGTLNMIHTLARVLTGVPAVAGGLTVTRAVSTSLSGSAAVAGALSRSLTRSLSVNGSPSASGALSLSTSQSFGPSGSPNPAGGLSLTRTEVLSLAATAMSVAGTLNLTQTRSLVLSGVAAAEGQGSINLPRTLALTLNGTPIPYAQMTRTHTRSLTVTGSPATGGTLNRTLTRSLAVAGSPAVAGTALLERAIELTVAGTPAVVGTLDLALSGELVLDGVPVMAGSLIILHETSLEMFGVAGVSSGVKMLLKDGTELHAFILVGGILVPVTPNFMES